MDESGDFIAFLEGLCYGGADGDDFTGVVAADSCIILRQVVWRFCELKLRETRTSSGGEERTDVFEICRIERNCVHFNEEIIILWLRNGCV